MLSLLNILNLFVSLSFAAMFRTLIMYLVVCTTYILDRFSYCIAKPQIHRKKNADLIQLMYYQRYSATISILACF